MNETQIITVRYWAGARHVAGTDADHLSVTTELTLVEVLARAVAEHPGTTLSDVVKACSVLVDDLPVGSRDPASVTVSPGQVVEVLPPFAGG
ncbi:MoaD/ThiS family protein [Nocardioides bruguierae]|uniref:MoaD/ThiS family protein n=1 Tax=Nocardioides bruguierae TaxID=2945102 RepID=A0A9X2DB28_9ACTN|nr:MoaD/ThiS family protein [Nocardioides bruguierae]MCM0622680.1 MoaD/ThiS family protein [Nocardioides bruguierae]